MSTTLKDALLAAGRDTIAFHNGGTDYPTPVADLPEETLLRIFDYGKRMFNDAVNGAKNQGAKPEEFAAEWLAKAKAGQLGTRTGGARLSAYEKALREIVRDYLKAAGWSAKDAAKDAKEPEAAFDKMLELQIARGKGIPTSQVTAEDIQAAVDKNWPKVETRAKKMAALAEGTAIDLDI